MRKLFRRLCISHRGVAVIEFAISAPILIIFTVYGIEAVNMAISRLRVEQTASSTADFTARIRETIDETDIESILDGAKVMGNATDLMARGRVIVSSLEMNKARTGQYIRWQRCRGAKKVVSSYGIEGDGRNDARLHGMGPVGNRVAATDGIPLIFVEIQYDYNPIVSETLFGPQTFSIVRAFPIRQRNDQAMKDVAHLRSSGRARRCNLFSAA